MSGKKSHPNYEERDDGYYKKDLSVVRGNAGYFSRPVPPVRDGYGHPLKPGGGTDWDRVERELREQRHGS